MSSRRVRIHVRGIVQGVAFRASTRHEARRRGLTGWVKNLPDGSVMLEAQGTADQVASIEAWCRRGPPAAEVEACEVEEREVVEGERGFEIAF